MDHYRACTQPFGKDPDVLVDEQLCLNIIFREMIVEVSRFREALNFTEKRQISKPLPALQSYPQHLICYSLLPLSESRTIKCWRGRARKPPSSCVTSSRHRRPDDKFTFNPRYAILYSPLS